MKKLGKIKLNRLEKADLGTKEMNSLRGGCCGCGCHYSGGGGGSSAYDNLNANISYGQHSYGGDIGFASTPGPASDTTC